MRKRLSRFVAGLAGFVYQRGVDLYRFSDWLDSPGNETDLTDAQMARMWSTAEPTTTANGTAKVIYTNRR